jgi:AcrR family transcriptional regulator
MFLDRGFDAVSVDDIADAAGMSSRTFFRYYDTKDEILRSYQRGLTDALVDAFAGQPEGTPAFTALRAAYVATSHVAPPDRERVRALGRLLATAPAVHARTVGETVLDDRIEAEFARRSRARRSDPRPGVVVAAIAAAATVGWNRWVARDDRRDPALAVAAAIDLLGLDG